MEWWNIAGTIVLAAWLFWLTTMVLKIRREQRSGLELPPRPKGRVISLPIIGDRK